jgi:hypothetical protein
MATVGQAWRPQGRATTIHAPPASSQVSEWQRLCPSHATTGHSPSSPGVTVLCLQRAWMGEYGDRKGSPLRYMHQPHFGYRSGGSCTRHATTGRSPSSPDGRHMFTNRLREQHGDRKVSCFPTSAHTHHAHFQRGSVRQERFDLLFVFTMSGTSKSNKGGK